MYNDNQSDYCNRQCLRFSFMDLIQKELDDVYYVWNTHVIRYSRRGVNGRPNELYYLPTIHGQHLDVSSKTNY